MRIIFILISIYILSCAPKYTSEPADKNKPIPLTVKNDTIGFYDDNPFSPTTTVKYQIEDSSQVVIVVYNVQGEIVDTLENSFKTPGSYSVTWDASTFENGIYFYKIIAGKYTAVKKMVVLK